MVGLAIALGPLPFTITAPPGETVVQPTDGAMNSSPVRTGPPIARPLPDGVQQRIFGRSLLLGGVLGGVGGYIGFQLGQQRAQTVCRQPEGCTSDWVLPLTGALLGAGTGLIFAPGYVAGNAGYRCDLDRRVLAYGGGALGGGLLIALGVLGQDLEALAQGLSLPWLLPIWACMGSLEPIETPESSL